MAKCTLNLLKKAIIVKMDAALATVEIKTLDLNSGVKRCLIIA